MKVVDVFVVATCLVLALVLQACSYDEEHGSRLSGAALNVYAMPLDTCSKPGMALTGFTRDGRCTYVNDDTGTHHICIKMKSDFCRVTGQPDWCNSEMPCMNKGGQCPVENWCVCQWAFAGYLAGAGGCDAVDEVVCNSTNLAAVQAYEQSNNPNHKRALACIKERCGSIDLSAKQSDSQMSVDIYRRLFAFNRGIIIWPLLGGVAGTISLVVVASRYFKSNDETSTAAYSQMTA